MCRTRKKAPPQFDGDERRARIRPVVVGVCRGSRPSAIVAPAAPLVSILPTTHLPVRENLGRRWTFNTLITGGKIP